MISRRDIIKWSAVAPALAAGSQAAFAKLPRGLDALLVDERFGLASVHKRPGVRLMRFSGDVTRVWYDELDASWRRRGFVLGGITGSDALFVLETLAQQQGRRVVSRSRLADPDSRGIAPVSWVIAPVHPSVLA